MMDRNIALAKNEWAAIAPSRQLRNKVRRRSQLYVQAKIILQRGELAKQHIEVWLKAQIDIDRRVSPTLQDSRCATRQIDSRWAARDPTEATSQLSQTSLVNRRAHARLPARSSRCEQLVRCSDYAPRRRPRRGVHRDDAMVALRHLEVHR